MMHTSRAQYSFNTLTILIAFFFSAFESKAFQSEIDFKVYHKETKEELIFYADNNELMPVSVRVNVVYEGLIVKKAAADFEVVPGQSETFVLSRFEIPRKAGWSFSYNTIFVKGNIYAQHNDDYAYALPFQNNTTYKLTQGYNGRFSHTNMNALDFTTPLGAPIHASREGLVVEVFEKSKRGCNSPKCMDDANYIRILHSDGTIASYSHLQFKGALVEVSETVERGQLIGKCGETGYASGPHLYFSVNKNTETGTLTLPTKFLIAPNETGALQEGKSYTAFEN